jgi:transcriptional regulator with XRE-family HTH domain
MEKVAETEIRPYNPTEIAFLVSTFRQAHGWSQEVLAELAGVTPRTVQRVEAAEPSSLDTRRALSRAFGMDDIDAFNRPHEMTTPEGAEKARREFDEKFEVIETEPVTGRKLVAFIASATPFRALHPGSVGSPPREIEDLYARIMDYLADIMDIAAIAGHVEMLGYGDEVEGRIAEMRTLGWDVASGITGTTVAGLKTQIVYVIAQPVGGGTRHLAVPRHAAT